MTPFEEYKNLPLKSQKINSIVWTDIKIINSERPNSHFSLFPDMLFSLNYHFNSWISDMKRCSGNYRFPHRLEQCITLYT